MSGPERAAPRRSPAGGESSVVDWRRIARRLRRNAVVIAAAVVVGWLVGGAVGDGATLALLGEVAGYGIGAMFVVEVVVVGGGAVRAMLRAGERGDRLAGGDVSVLPPQVRRRRMR